MVQARSEQCNSAVNSGNCAGNRVLEKTLHCVDAWRDRGRLHYATGAHFRPGGEPWQPCRLLIFRVQQRCHALSHRQSLSSISTV
jgi:hypothetical protein